MDAILLSDIVWEGPAKEMTEDLPGLRDGHFFKQTDTGESYFRRNGVWEFINLGLSFIKATKSGLIITDSNGEYSVVFDTPFISNDYSIALSCKEIPSKEIPLAVYDNQTAEGFDIYSYNTVKKAIQPNAEVSWLTTRNYNP